MTGIKCPHCGGMVGKTRRGETLDEALDRHIELTHRRTREGG